MPQDHETRHIDAICRWAFVGLTVAAALFWYYPGYRNWAGLAFALLALWTAWLARQIVRGRPSMPGHPLYLAMLAPAAVLLWHFAHDCPRNNPDWTDASGPGGAIDASFLFQLGLLGLGTMLAQDFFPRDHDPARDDRRDVPPGSQIAACGVLAVGPVLMLQLAPAGKLDGSLVAVGLGSSLLLLACLWQRKVNQPAEHDTDMPGGAARSRNLSRDRGRCREELRAGMPALPPRPQTTRPGHPEWPPCHPGWRAAWYAGLLMAAGIAVIGSLQSPVAMVWSALSACTLVLGAAFVLHWRRVGLLVAFLLFGMGVSLAGALLPADFIGNTSIAAVGQGESAFAQVYAGDWGSAVLGRLIGPYALGWFVLGSVAAGLWLVWPLRRAGRDTQVSAVLWLAGTAAVSGSIFLPGGLFSPLVLAASAYAWGLLPAMARRDRRMRSAWPLLAVLVVLSTVMGLASMPGLAQWAVSAWGRSRDFLHIPTGFFVSLCLGWLLGRRLWLGVLGVVGGGLVGGAGEILQFLFSRRGVEWEDWGYHAVGSAGAAILFILAFYARPTRVADCAK